MGNVISNGADYTWEFQWIREDEKRAQMISNFTC